MWATQNEVTSLETKNYELKAKINDLNEKLKDKKNEYILKEKLLNTQIFKQKNKFECDLKKAKEDLKNIFSKKEKSYNNIIKELKHTIKKLENTMRELNEKNLVLQADISVQDFNDLTKEDLSKINDDLNFRFKAKEIAPKKINIRNMILENENLKNKLKEALNKPISINDKKRSLIMLVKLI